jgi:hypothetical protein
MWKGKSRKAPEMPPMDVPKEMPRAAAKGTRGWHSMPAVGKYMEAPWFVKICKKLFQIKHEIIYFVLHGFYNKRDYMICHPHKAGFPPDSAAPVC